MPRVTYPITRQASGRWQARWRDPDGRQRAKTFQRKIDAQQFLDDARSQIRHGNWIDPKLGRERFADFAERWSAARDWKASTRESFAPHLRRINDHLGTLRLDEIDRLALERTRKGLVDAGYARTTATISFHYATTIMRAAYQSALIARDPTIGLKPPRRRVGDPDGRVTPDQVPTRAEVLAILSGAPDRFRAAVALGVAGLRVSEMLAVTSDRIDLERNELMIDRQLQRIDGRVQFTGPKREKVRTIVLPPVTMLELRRHLRDHGPFWPIRGGDPNAGLLFRGNRHAPMRRDAFYDSAWRPALIAAGLTPDAFRFHSLRHFCASSLLAEGAPITAVAGHLGDTVETVSRTYLHWLRDDRQVPAIVLDRLLSTQVSDAEVDGS